MKLKEHIRYVQEIHEYCWFRAFIETLKIRHYRWSQGLGNGKVTVHTVSTGKSKNK